MSCGTCQLIKVCELVHEKKTRNSFDVCSFVCFVLFCFVFLLLLTPFWADSNMHVNNTKKHNVHYKLFTGGEFRTAWLGTVSKLLSRPLIWTVNLPKLPHFNPNGEMTDNLWLVMSLRVKRIFSPKRISTRLTPRVSFTSFDPRPLFQPGRVRPRRYLPCSIHFSEFRLICFARKWGDTLFQFQLFLSLLYCIYHS